MTAAKRKAAHPRSGRKQSQDQHSSGTTGRPAPAPRAKATARSGRPSPTSGQSKGGGKKAAPKAAKKAAPKAAKKAPARKPAEKPETAKRGAKRTGYSSPSPSTPVSATAASDAQSELVSRIKEIAESNSELRDEIRSIAKTFSGNQKRMSSIGGMSESLEAVLVQIQKQSRQISGLKKETQGLAEDLEEISAQHAAIERLEAQMGSIQQQVARAADSMQADAKSDAAASKRIGDGLLSIRDNSESIAKLSEAVDAVRREIKKVAARSASAAGTGAEIDTLRSEITKISDVTQPGSMMGVIMGELEGLAGRIAEFSKRQEEQDALGGGAAFDPGPMLESISAGSSRIEQMGEALDAFREQMGQINSRAAAAESAGAESARLIAQRLGEMGDQMRSIVQKEIADTMAASAAASDGDGDKDYGREEFSAIRDGIAEMRSDMAGSIRDMRQRIEAASEKIHGQESGASDIYAKIREIHEEIRSVRDHADTHRQAASDDTSRLLKLSEYQSVIRMNAESKYGDLEMISHMAQRTAEIAALFECARTGPREGLQDALHDGGSGDGSGDGHGDLLHAGGGQADTLTEEGGGPAGAAGDYSDDGATTTTTATAAGNAPLPLDVKRWAVGKMFDCADRWEIRFSDAYASIKSALGPRMLAESLRMQQIRDIYGIRAVNEIRGDLGGGQPS